MNKTLCLLFSLAVLLVVGSVLGDDGAVSKMSRVDREDIARFQEEQAVAPAAVSAPVVIVPTPTPTPPAPIVIFEEDQDPRELPGGRIEVLQMTETD